VNWPWVTAGVACATFALGVLIHAVSLSFRVGEQARDMEAIKRMLGLANGTEAVFMRQDIAQDRFAQLGAKVDSLSEALHKSSEDSSRDRAALRDQLTEIKVLLAQRP